MNGTVLLQVLVLIRVVMHTHAQSCPLSNYVNMNGDVILAGLFNIHTTTADGKECGTTLEHNAIQRLEAFLFAIDLVNTVSFIPGVSFGALAYDTCGLSSVASQRALRWLAQSNVGEKGQCNVKPLHLGMVGPMYTGPAHGVVSLLTSAHVSQIAYGAGGSSLDDRTVNQYLLRTVPSGQVAAKVLIDIIEEFGWHDLAVISGPGRDEDDQKRDAYRLAGSRGMCIVSEIKVDLMVSKFPKVIEQLEDLFRRGVTGIVLFTLPPTTERFFSHVQNNLLSHPTLGRFQWLMGLPFTDSPSYNRLKDATKGLVSFELNARPVRGFRDYFSSLRPQRNARNPWFSSFWEQRYNCSLNRTCGRGHITTHRKTFRQAQGVAQTVAAVYAYAQGFKDAHADLCGNQTGVCASLAAMSTERLRTYLYRSTFINLDGQIVAFDKKGDLAAPVYAVRNVQIDGVAYSMQKIGSWTEKRGLRLQTRFKIYDDTGRSTEVYPASRCLPRSCQCRNQLHDERYGEMSGDEYILQGIFDVHGGEEGSGEGGPGRAGVVECAGRPHRLAVQAIEAMYYAVDLINADPAILPGTRLGVAAFDSCRSPERARRHTSQLLTGAIKIPSLKGPETKLVASIGGASSDVSMAVAKMLAPHRLTQISYASTSSPLDDKNQYPYFLRTVGSDYAQTRVIVDIIRSFNWSYVKVIFSDNAYGNSAVRDFLKLSESNNICVATQVKLAHYLTKDTLAMRNIIQYYLMETYQSAKVVVMFVTDTHAQKITEAMRSLIGRMKSHDFIFLASDHWGARQSVPRGVEDIVNGAVTVDFLTQNVPDFLRYFQNLRPWANSRNPWFSEYWQHHFHCYLSGDLAQTYNESCDPNLTLLNEHITMATHVPLVINAVYAAALGLHNLNQEFCGPNSTGICTQAKKNIHLLHSYVRDLRFYNGVTKSNVSFDVLGSSAPTYKVYNFRQTALSVYEYVEVGNFENGRLHLDKSEVYAPKRHNASARTMDISSECTPTSKLPCACSTLALTDLKYQLQYGRLTLLGYFPVHGPDVGGAHCHHFRSRQGFEALMAFKYAIERVNRDPKLLNNVTLGYMIFDTCSSPQKAREAFTAFDRSLRFFAQAPQLPVLSYIHAFVGGFDDEVGMILHDSSVEGQNLVQISPASTAESLSNKIRYPRFLRTVAPDSMQARALVAVLKGLRWTYISLVHDKTTRNLGMLRILEKILNERGVCIATKESLGERQSGDYYDRVVHSLSKHEGAVGVIVLAGPETTRELFKAVERSRALGRFVFVGTEEWGESEVVLQGLSHVVRGSLIIVPDSGQDLYFDRFMRRVTPVSDPHNPWLREFWQEHFKCNLDFDGGHARACTGQETLDNATFSTNPHVINTINAVYSYAYGLTKLFNERCGDMVIPPCEALSGGDRTSSLVYDYIKNVIFTGADGKPFQFTDNGDGAGRYRVLNYQLETAGHFQKIGEWFAGKLFVNTSRVKMYNADQKVVMVESQCPDTCNCSRRQLILDTRNVPIEFNANRQVWGILVITFSVLGTVFALVIIVFFIFKFRHPVVVGATTSLSVFLLLGIIFLYMLNFAFMFSPTWTTCGIRRFGLGFFYAMVFSLLLVKAIRILRISRNSSHTAPVFVSGPSQCFAAFILSSIQLVLNAEWLIIAPPEMQWYLEDISDDGYYPDYVVRWRCGHSKRALVASLCYVFLLIILTFSFSLRTIRACHFQREAFYIFLSTVCTVLTLVGWLVVYIVGPEKYAIPGVCIGLTLNASAILVLIFTRKMLELTAPSQDFIRGPPGHDYDSHYAVPKRDKNNSHGKGRSSRGIENELSEQTVYSPYAGRQMASF